MELLLIGLATAFNFVVIIRKYRLHRFIDGTLDMCLMALICILFSGTFSALTVGMIASMAISVYLYFNPVTLAGILGSVPKTRKTSASQSFDDFDDDF